MKENGSMTRMRSGSTTVRVGIAGAPRGASYLAGLRAAGAAQLVAVYDPVRDFVETIIQGAPCRLTCTRRWT